MSETNVRVLVLDDDEMQLELVERTLSHEGFDVRCAANLQQLEDVGPPFAPHIVLVDMNMPDTPSEQAVATARAALPTARIVIYSAWEESKLRAMCRDLGADGYVSKGDSVFAIGKRLAKLYGPEGQPR